VAFGNQILDRRFEYFSFVVFDFDPQFIGALTTVDC